ncbi:MAG: hypothetical protein LBS19_02295 [Clostridiales bacterium]|jgi:hypothetical protein|nr:hypothetical protein [Clostridiales bacterium]
MKGGIGSVILGWIIWQATGNILIGAVASFVLWPLISGILDGSKSLIRDVLRTVISLFEPQCEITALKEPDASKSKSSGLRILVTIKAKTASGAQDGIKGDIETTVNAALKHARDISKPFRNATDYIQEHNFTTAVYASRYKLTNKKCEDAFRRLIKRDGFICKGMFGSIAPEEITGFGIPSGLAGMSIQIHFILDGNTQQYALKGQLSPTPHEEFVIVF